MEARDNTMELVGKWDTPSVARLTSAVRQHLLAFRSPCLTCPISNYGVIDTRASSLRFATSAGFSLRIPWYSMNHYQHSDVPSQIARVFLLTVRLICLNAIEDVSTVPRTSVRRTFLTPLSGYFSPHAVSPNGTSAPP